MLSLTDTSVVRSTSDQVSCDVAGEAVVLKLSSGIYFGLNDTAALVWKLIQQPRSVGELILEVRNEFHVGEEECRADLHHLIAILVDAGLAEVSVAPAA